MDGPGTARALRLSLLRPTRIVTRRPARIVTRPAEEEAGLEPAAGWCPNFPGRGRQER
jgi:hypothetical protein